MVRKIGRGVIEIHGIVTNAYHIWRGMRQRCNNPQNPKFESYGARGITVCKEWDDSFLAFHQDLGERPTLEHSIERIDNDGPYCKDNCKWGTATEQVRNRRVARFVEIDGERVHLAVACAQAGIGYPSALGKLNRGATFNAPTQHQHHLTAAEAGQVKWLIRHASYPAAVVARRYGVSGATIHGIQTGRLWPDAAEQRPTIFPDTTLPTPRAVQYLNAIHDWRSSDDVATALGLPRGKDAKTYLGRLHAAGLAEYRDRTFYRITSAGRDELHRVRVCP